MWLEWFACWYGCWLCRSIMIWFDWKSPRFDMYVNGFTKLSTWIQWICKVGLYANFDSQDPSGLRWTALNVSQYRLGRGRVIMLWCVNWNRGWLVCNVCGSVAFSYVLMHLDGQLNIANIGNDISRGFSLCDLNQTLITVKPSDYRWVSDKGSSSVGHL